MSWKEPRDWMKINKDGTPVTEAQLAEMFRGWNAIYRFPPPTQAGDESAPSGAGSDSETSN